MIWEIKFVDEALKELKKLSRETQKEILNFLNNKLSKIENPKILGKPLVRDMFGLWRYRVNKHRIICQIKKEEIKILIVKIGKRDQVYKNK